MLGMQKLHVGKKGRPGRTPMVTVQKGKTKIQSKYRICLAGFASRVRVDNGIK
jgi:hypothetical protein